MNCTYRRPVRNRKVYVPHYGNIVNELFNTPVTQVVRNTNRKTSSPSVNILNTDDDITLNLAIPGHGKEDIKITIDNDVLTISSTIEKTKLEGGEFRLKEFDYRGFERSFVLPDTLDQENVNATFKDGILTLAIAKKEEAKPQPAKTINIK